METGRLSPRTITWRRRKHARMDRAQRLALALFLGICVQSCAEPREAPPEHGIAGEAAVGRLSPEALSALRDSFNAAEGSVRILVMLSPT